MCSARHVHHLHPQNNSLLLRKSFVVKVGHSTAATMVMSYRVTATVFGWGAACRNQLGAGNQVVECAACRVPIGHDQVTTAYDGVSPPGR